MLSQVVQRHGLPLPTRTAYVNPYPTDHVQQHICDTGPRVVRHATLAG